MNEKVADLFYQRQLKKTSGEYDKGDEDNKTEEFNHIEPNEDKKGKPITYQSPTYDASSQTRIRRLLSEEDKEDPTQKQDEGIGAKEVAPAEELRRSKNLTDLNWSKAGVVEEDLSEKKENKFNWSKPKIEDKE